MAAAAQTEEPSKGPSLVIQIVLLLVLTVAAIGAGWFSGGMLAGESVPASADARKADGAGEDDGHGGAKKSGHGDDERPMHVGELTPNILLIDTITTNLAAPADIWARLEGSLVFTGSPDAMTAEAIHQDFLAYLRTVKLHQIEGASGYQHLKEDLAERARIRSGGTVNQILVRTLLFE